MWGLVPLDGKAFYQPSFDQGRHIHPIGAWWEEKWSQEAESMRQAEQEREGEKKEGCVERDSVTRISSRTAPSRRTGPCDTPQKPESGYCDRVCFLGPSLPLDSYNSSPSPQRTGAFLCPLQSETAQPTHKHHRSETTTEE